MSSRARPSILFFRVIVAALALASVMVPCAAQSVYNPATDFSSGANPGGAWSYGYANFPGPITLFPLASTFGDPFVPAWRNSESYPASYPVVFYNASGAPVAYSGTLTLPTGQFGLHPGDVGSAVARLTLPVGGTYLLDAAFFGLESFGSGTSTDVHIYINGASVLDGAINGFGSSSVLSNYSFAASAGWTVDFFVGDGGNGSIGDTTGLTTVLVAVPEISTAGLWLALGALAPILIYRRKM